MPSPTGAAGVYGGAMLICDCGYAPSSLRITEAGRAVAIVRDSIAFVNVAPFGMCSSLANPGVLNATQAAMGTMTPMPCTPVIVGQWAPPGAPITLVVDPPAPALGMNSRLRCAYGGTINIVSSGG
jgi:hypothetical protein